MVNLLLQFNEDDFQLRTRGGYNNCTSIENSDADITGVYGINHRSILNQSRYFHVVGGLPGDAMHDVLEGVLQYEAKEYLKYTINEQKYFTLSSLISGSSSLTLDMLILQIGHHLLQAKH